MMSRWENHITVSYSVQSLLKQMVYLCLASHMMACAWGLIGRSYSTIDYPCTDINHVVFPETSFTWIEHVHSGKMSSDDPCSSLVLYLWSLHWSVMSITSIGYGDVVPVQIQEYFVCILCMLIGGVLWASIIGSLCGVRKAS